MPRTLNIPEDHKKSFSRLVDLVPVPFRYEEQIQKDILLFLKIEGEEFVRNKIEQSIGVFSNKTDHNSLEVKKER